MEGKQSYCCNLRVDAAETRPAALAALRRSSKNSAILHTFCVCTSVCVMTASTRIPAILDNCEILKIRHYEVNKAGPAGRSQMQFVKHCSCTNLSKFSAVIPGKPKPANLLGRSVVPVILSSSCTRKLPSSNDEMNSVVLLGAFWTCKMSPNTILQVSIRSRHF